MSIQNEQNEFFEKLKTQGGRLEYFMELKKIKSQQKLADSIKVSKSSVNKVLTSSSNFEVKNYIKLYEVYKLSPNWLILGVEPMYLDGKNAVSIVNSGRITAELVEATRKIAREELNLLLDERGL